MKTVEEFCRIHNACRLVRVWAVFNCKTMQEVWSTAPPDWLLWVATRPVVLTDEELRLFSAWCARQGYRLVKGSVDVLDVAERYAHGTSSYEELAAARDAAEGAQAAWLRENTSPNFN